MTATLTRTATGYRTADGRFTVEPRTIGDSPRNKGTRQWKITDHANPAAKSKIAVRLYEARDYITLQYTR